LYKYLEHTADILIEAHGKTFEEAIEEAARAMFNVIGNAEPKIKKNIHSEAPTKEQLVVYFLSDLLTEMEIDNIVFSDVKIQKVEHNKNWEINAIVMGDHVLPTDQVKAVTHHMLEIKKEKNEWVIRVLLDV